MDRYPYPLTNIFRQINNYQSTSDQKETAMARLQNLLQVNLNCDALQRLIAKFFIILINKLR